MKIVKKQLVADITYFPEKIKRLLYKKYSGCSQNTYVNIYVHDEQKPRSEHKGGEILFVDKDCDYIVERGDDPISDYLYDEEGLKNRETVLLKIWW